MENENFISSIYAQIVAEQDEVVMQMIEDYVRQKQRSGEICIPLIIEEGKIRHIFNLGLAEYRRIQNNPRKIGSKPYFPESVYVEFLQEKINRLKFENNQLIEKLDDIENHIPHID